VPFLKRPTELIKSGKKAFPEIMIPVTCTVNELIHQKKIVDRVYKEVCEKTKMKKIPYLYGTHDRNTKSCTKSGKDGNSSGFL